MDKQGMIAYLSAASTREEREEIYRACVAAFNVLKRGQRPPRAWSEGGEDLGDHQKFTRYLARLETTDELNEVIRLNNAYARMDQQAAAARAMVQLRRGQSVKFTFRGEPKEGTIINFGSKRVTIVEKDGLLGQKFHVPPTQVKPT